MSRRVKVQIVGDTQKFERAMFRSRRVMRRGFKIYRYGINTWFRWYRGNGLPFFSFAFVIGVRFRNRNGQEDA